MESTITSAPAPVNQTDLHGLVEGR